MGFASRGISTADIAAALKTGSAQTLRFYSEQIDCFITGAAVTRALSSITLPNLTGLGAIKHAYAGLFFIGYGQFVSKLNKLDGLQYIQVDTGSAGWLSAITLDNAQFGVSDEGMTFATLMGHVDVKAKVAFNATTDFQWLDSMVDDSSVYLHPVCILEIIV